MLTEAWGSVKSRYPLYQVPDFESLLPYDVSKAYGELQRIGLAVLANRYGNPGVHPDLVAAAGMNKAVFNWLVNVIDRGYKSTLEHVEDWIPEDDLPYWQAGNDLPEYMQRLHIAAIVNMLDLPDEHVHGPIVGALCQSVHYTPDEMLVLVRLVKTLADTMRDDILLYLTSIIPAGMSRFTDFIGEPRQLNSYVDSVVQIVELVTDK